MMKLDELREFLNKLPKKFDNYGVVNGEVGIIEGSEVKGGKEDLVYRCDKPIITLYVDEDSEEICFFHQTQEDVSKIHGDKNGEETKE